MLNNLNSASRVSEVGATALSLNGAFQNSSLSRETYLESKFSQLANESAHLAEAINRTKAESNLDPKRATRAYEARALSYLVKGYTFHPDPVIKAAAQQVDAVVGKYSLKALTDSSFATGTMQITSLLTDLADETLLPSITALSGVAEIITALQTAQADFEAAYVAFQEEKASEGALKNASEIKKNMLSIINNQLVAYLRVMVLSDEAGYGEFVRTVTQIIDETNETVEKRAREEEPEVPAE